MYITHNHWTWQLSIMRMVYTGEVPNCRIVTSDAINRSYIIHMGHCHPSACRWLCCRCWWSDTSNDAKLWCTEVFQSSSGVWNTSPRPSPRLLLSTNKLWQWHSCEYLGAGRRGQQGCSLCVSWPQQPAVLRMWCRLSRCSRASQVLHVKVPSYLCDI